ncbi:MAG: hypothetical protein J7J15_02025 [Candidatus Aenigmarchaeota archaeon]|nr:hypothetical protein [Candidatus Aenigmarchaeota archaeon]
MRTFDKNSLHFISLFELVTGVAPIDCVIKDIIYFVVPKEKINIVLTKGRKKIKTLEKHIGKQVVVYPYFKTKEEFIKGVISDRVKIKDSDNSLKIFINRLDNKKVKRDREAITSFLKRIYNVENVLFRF